MIEMMLVMNETPGIFIAVLATSPILDFFVQHLTDLL